MKHESAPTSVVVPNTLSSFSNADFVHTMKRPRCPPGASCSERSWAHHQHRAPRGTGISGPGSDR